MSFVIYNKETTVLLHHWNKSMAVRCDQTEFPSMRAAKIVFGKHMRNSTDPKAWADSHAIEDKTVFEASIEKKKVVYSIHDTKKEKPIEIPVNTPACCDPSCETYWTM